jgi:IS5 family transposase
MLKTGTVVDATNTLQGCIKAKKGNQRHFDMTTHIGVDTRSKLVPSVIGTAMNRWCLRTPATREKTKGPKPSPVSLATSPAGQVRTSRVRGAFAWAVHRQGKASESHLQAKVELPFRVIKQQLGYAEIRYRRLARNTDRLTKMFVLSNV